MYLGEVYFYIPTYDGGRFSVGAKAYQSSVNDACGQFPTQRISGSYPDYVINEVMAVGNRYAKDPNLAGKDHALTYEGDQNAMFKLKGKPTMMAGNVGMECRDGSLSDIKITFCPAQ
mgnify:FL=1